MAWVPPLGFVAEDRQRLVERLRRGGRLLGDAARGAAVPIERQVVGDGGEQVGSLGRTLVENDQPSAELEGLGDVVGDHEHRHAGVAPERRGELLHIAADAGVEGAEGLVEEQHLRLLEERLGDGEALLHAAGELGRVAVPRLAEADIDEEALDLVR